jgi:4-amino-4-deoxy-L-arabinose transferase-like glycosyltransferase
LRLANKESLVVLLITLAALSVRLYGISFGLPYIYQTDDAWMVNHAVALGSGDLNPHIFLYPSLLIYVLFFFYGVYCVVGLVLGLFHSVDDFARLFFTNPTVFYLIGRSFSALLGTATIPLVYLLGKRMYDAKVGLVASLFLSFAFAHVELSHYVKGQVPAGFLAAVSFLFIYMILQKGERKHYALAGFLAGLAMSMRYESALLALPLLLAHIFRLTKSNGRLRNIVLSQNALLGYLCLAGGFLFGTPFALLDFGTFVKDLAVVRYVYTTSRIFWHPEWYYYPLSLVISMGELIAILVGVEVLYSVYSRDRRDILLMSFPIAVTAFLSLNNVKHENHLVPILPFLALVGARSLVLMASKLKLSGAKQSTVIALLATAVVLSPAIRVVRWDYLISQKDTRTLAKEWIEQNISEGSKIMLDSGKYYVSTVGPPIQDRPENLRKKYTASLVAGSSSIAERSGSRFRSTYYHESEYRRYQMETVSGPTYDLVPIVHDEMGRTQMKPIEYYKAQGIQYVIFSSSAKWLYAPGFHEALDSKATLIKQFKSNLTDRPGPTLKIYRLER